MLITNEDNMELMARYPDNYFDLAIVDPPYGINLDGGGSSCLLVNGKETIKPSDPTGERPVPAVFYIK